MKIAMVVGLYPNQIGGAEMQAREIAMALQAQGHSVYYICYSPKYYSSEEYEVHIIPTRTKYDVFYWGVKRNLDKSLEEIHPDVVYHRAFVPYSRFIARWCVKNRVPFYFHCADIYTLIRKNDSLYNMIQNKWLKYTLNNATGVICQNKEQYEALQKYNLRRLEIIYNIQRINQQLVNSNKQKEIIWVAKFEPAKQPEIFVELAERFSGSDLIFTMFSSKCPQTEVNEQLLTRIKSNPRITLVNGKDNKFINSYLCSNAAVLVNTSVSEGISNTFIQAWMRGVPVVSLNSNPDNWFDKNSIGACCNGDRNKLAASIARILDEKNYKYYSSKSIEFAESNFSPEKITPRLLNFMHLN